MLLDDLKNLKGATIATITTQTEPKLKSAPHLKGLVKLSTVQVILGSNYTNAVNNQLERENKDTEFKSEPRKWGERIKGTPLVEHKGKFYLECQILKPLNKVYWLNGPRDDDEITPYLPQSKSRQGTDKEVFWRDYSMESLVKVVMNGHTYCKGEIM